MLGIYRHWKGAMYEVTGTSVYCTGKDLFTLVHYTCLETGKYWSRSRDDFLSKVETGEQRFILIKPLDSPRVLLKETIKMSKDIWDKCKADDPAWLSNGMGGSLQYVVGDKIAFALSIRLINRAEAEQLLKEVREWS